MEITALLRSSLERELESDRERLREVLELPNDSNRVGELRKLAIALGASTIRIHPGYGEANQPELVANIHGALQTKAMIAAVKTSSNYVILTGMLTLVAVASLVLALFAAFR